MNIVYSIKKIVLIFRLIYLKIYITKVEKLSFKVFNNYSSKNVLSPIDRFTIESYIGLIQKLDYKKFIIFNFKWFPENYAIRLMTCLPEVFKKVTYDDLVFIVGKINEPLPIISFLNFLQLYLGVDYLKVLSSSDIHDKIRKMVLEHINRSKPLSRVSIHSTDITKEKVGINLSDFYSSLSLLHDTVPPL